MDTAHRPKTSESVTRRTLQFSIETLLLVTTLSAVCLAVTVGMPPLGVWLSIIAAAALVRTLIVGKQYQAAAMPFPAAEKVSEFLTSVGIMILALVVWFLALLTVGCSGGLAIAMVSDVWSPSPKHQILHSTLFVLFWLVAIFLPIAAAGWFLWITRPR